MVNFSLTGGIGNQLFIYAAGIAYANSSGKKVKFLVQDPNVGDHKDSDIRELNLDGHFVQVSHIDRKVNFRKKLTQTSVLTSKIFRIWTSSKSGYDPELLSLEKIRSVDGNFQTFRYAQSLRFHEGYKNFNIRNPSGKFLSFMQVLDQGNTVALHVRRGDYSKYKSKFGLLNEKYFASVLEEICSNTEGELNIFVFSDDLEEARSVIKFEHSKAKIHFLDDLNSLSAAETLVLMSIPKNIIISNSTFSWWAAFLGQKEKLVFVPDPWFKSKSVPEDLIPLRWVRVPAIWEE